MLNFGSKGLLIQAVLGLVRVRSLQGALSECGTQLLLKISLAARRAAAAARGGAAARAGSLARVSGILFGVGRAVVRAGPPVVRFDIQPATKYTVGVADTGLAAGALSERPRVNHGVQQAMGRF